MQLGFANWINLLVLVAYISSCSPQSEHVYRFSYPSESEAPIFEQKISSSFNKWDIPALQLSVFSLEKGIVYQFNHGLEKKGKALSDSSHFESASLSKPVFAFLIYQIISAGNFTDTSTLLSLQTEDNLFRKQAYDERYRRLEDYLNSEQKRLILSKSVGNILMHKAGFKDWWEPTLDVNQSGNFKYSGEGYIALQRFLENHFKQSLSSLLDSFHVFQDFSGKSEPFVAHGFDKNGNKARSIWKPTEALSHGTLWANNHDLIHFMQRASKKGMIEWAMQEKVKVPEYENLYWTKGWGLEIWENQPIIWHWGNDTHFQNIMLYLPNEDYGFVYQTNSQNGLELADEFCATFLGEKELELLEFCR